MKNKVSPKKGGALNKVKFANLFTKSNRKNAPDLRNGYQVKRPWERTKEEKTERTMDDVGVCITTTGIICVILLPVSAVMNIVGTATPFWFDTGAYNIGLFQRCKIDNNVCEDVKTYLSTAASDMKFTWTLVTGLNLSGACLLLLTSFFCCFYLRCKVRDNTKASYGMLIAVLIMIGGGCTVSGTVVMTSYYLDNLQVWSLAWSYYLAAVGAGISFVIFCLFVIYVCLLTFSD